MTNEYYVLKIAERQLMADVEKAKKAVDRSRDAYIKNGTIATGATKKSYQKRKIVWTANCQILSKLEGWLETCREMITKAE